MRPRASALQAVISAIIFGNAVTTRAQTAPSITAQPASQIVLVGTNVLLSAGVSGPGPYTYQWRFNGTNIANDVITSVAGGGDGGSATNSILYRPFGVAVDGSGNLFLADAGYGIIRKVGTNGILTRVAGGGPNYPGDGTTALLASLIGPGSSPNSNTVTGVGGPSGLALDAFGNLLIATPGDQRVRVVTADGVIFTLAGDGLPGYSGDGGAASVARLSQPAGVAADNSGNVFIADTGNSCIRKIGTDGIISTVAGKGISDYSGDGGPATNASLSFPTGVTVDAAGNLYIADRGNNCIRVIGTNGIINTVAGRGTNYPGDGAAAVNASLSSPSGVAADSAGNLFIADQGHNCVRKIGTDGIIRTVAGNGTYGYSGDGGAATNASLSGPTGVALDSSGNLWIADYYNGRIRKVSNGIIFTVAGTGSFGYSGDDGGATNASMYVPRAAAVDGAGNLFIADQNNHRIRKVATNGLISTVAGTGYPAFYGEGWAATNAGLYLPSGVAVDSAGNVYIADSQNNRIRKVGTDGLITTVAGNGYNDHTGDGGPATNASLYQPLGVAVDGLGNLFIADTRNDRIRKVDTSGIINTVAGNGSHGFSGDGGSATNASLRSPWGVAVDSVGNLFIADYYNYRVRRVDPSGTITTVAGSSSAGFSGDGGPATAAKFRYPAGLAVDGAGNLFVADCLNNRIRKVAPDGIITTVAGNDLHGYSGDGASATIASLWDPLGVAVDPFGNLLIADQGNNRIRQIGGPGISLRLNNISPANSGTYDVVASNAYGSVTSLVATLTVALPPLSARATTDGVQLQLRGASGAAYVLLATTDLTSPVAWTPLSTNTADLAGNWTFTETNSGAYGSRFYRVSLP